MDVNVDVFVDHRRERERVCILEVRLSWWGAGENNAILKTSE